MKPAQALHEAGKSLWLGTITRGQLERTSLERSVHDPSSTGLTSNSTSVDPAITQTKRQLEAAARAGSPEQEAR